MFTVVETPLFQKLWPTYWTEEERGEFATFLSASPDAGVVVKDSGDIRKVRWKRQGTGKSGGVRVIYFVKNEAEEIVLLLIYAKSETDNIKGAVLKEIRHAIED
jgi:mRNA-degrading endonuclease RelE of RelBE toxin-antitoxin system